MKTRLFVLLVAVVALLAGCDNTAQKEAEYVTSVEAVQKEIVRTTYLNDEAAQMIHAVWSNTIYKRDDFKTDPYTKKNHEFVEDFNVALLNYQTSDDYLAITKGAKDRQADLAIKVKELRDAEGKIDPLYEALNTLYDAGDRIVTLAVEPTGNLTSYTQDYNSAQTDFLKAEKDLTAEIELAKSKNKK